MVVKSASIALQCDGLMAVAQKVRVTLFFLAFFSTMPAVGNDAQHFLNALEGQWFGKAEVTPVGPRPYDITFRRILDGRMAGSANPGAAIHYWDFYEYEGKMHLRFLTTFAGNQEPVLLDAREWEDNGILFRAEKLPILSVRVAPLADSLMIDVYHWNELHVSIRLNRP